MALGVDENLTRSFYERLIDSTSRSKNVRSDGHLNAFHEEILKVSYVALISIIGIPVAFLCWTTYGGMSLAYAITGQSDAARARYHQQKLDRFKVEMDQYNGEIRAFERENGWSKPALSQYVFERARELYRACQGKSGRIKASLISRPELTQQNTLQVLKPYVPTQNLPTRYN